jgi:hypothetical protein
MDLSKQEQLAVLFSREKEIAAAIYNAVISKRVAERVHDDQLEKKAIAELERLEKIKDVLEELKKEIDAN